MPDGREGRSGFSEAEKDITERKRTDEVSRHRAELDALQATVLDITSQRELSTLLYAIVERSVQLLMARSGAMYMCDPGRKEVRLTVSYKTSRDFTGTVLKYGEGAAGIAAQTEKPVILDDYRKWQGRALVFEEESPFTAVLSVPMIWQGRIVGVIDVMDDVESRRFTQEDQELLTMFANHAAIAVQRQQTEQKLRLQSEIAENMSEGVVLTRASDGVIVYANPRFEKMFGYGSGELVGKKMATMNAPTNGKSPEDVHGEIRASLNIHGSWSGEVHNARKDGTFFWCRANISTLESSEYGRVWVETHEDITERKQMEDEIRNLARFPSENPNPVLRLDKEGRVLTANQASKALLEEWNCELGQTAPRFWRDLVTEALSTGQSRNLDIKSGGRYHTFLVKPIVETSNVNFYGRDITERKQAEEALGEAEAKLRLVLETGGDPMGLYDPEGKLLMMNRQGAANLLGKPEDFTGKSIREFVPENADTYLARIKEAASTRLPKEYEDHVELPVGSRWFLSTYKPIVDVDEKIYAIQVISKDITERKRSEEALQEANQFNRAVISGAREGIIVYDLDLNYRIWNRFMEQLTGMPAEKVLGQNALELFPHLRQQGVDLLLKKALLGETVASPNTPFQIPETDKSGWVSGVYGPLHDVQGKIVGVIGLVRDVAEHVRMEEELRRYSTQLEQLVAERTRELAASKDFAENLIQTANAIVVGLGNDGNVRFLNQAAERITGYTGKELEGRNWFEVIAPKNRYPEVWAEFERLRAGGLPRNFENPILTKSGEERYVVWQNSEVREQGQVVGTISFGIDITERKRMEEAVRESEKRFRTLVEGSAVAMAVFSGLQGDVYLVNRKFTELLGYTLEDVPDLAHWWPLAYPDQKYRDQVKAEWNRKVEEAVRTRNEIEPIELAVTCKDGSTRQVELHSSWVGDRIVSTLVDLTEHKQMEEDLRSARGQLEHVITSSPAVIYAGKPNADHSDFDAIYVSTSVVSLLGFEAQEFIGHSELWYSRIHPDDLRRYLAEIPVLWKEGQHTFEYRFLTKDEAYRWIREEAKVIRDVTGKPVEVMGYWTDITERRRMEEEIRAARERLEFMIASNPAVIYAGKPLADRSDFVLTYVSDRVVAMLGFEAREFIGHPEFWQRRVHPEDLRSVLAEMPRLWKEGQYSFDYRFLHKDGAYRWIREEPKVVRDADGKPIEVNGYWTDITERKRLEEALAKSQQLAAIGETSAMVGHDLRNPLQGIAGIVYLAKRNLEFRKATDRRDAAGMLDTIQEQVMYMDKIVSDLQDYAQPVVPKLTETDLPNLIRQTLSTIKVPAAVKVSVEVEKAAQNVMIDPTLMRRTFTNLAINAIQAMPKRGKLTVRARSKGDSTIMTVEDTGEGIPKKNLARLFSPFFTTKAKGQGLGLAVCKRLVEAQGGTITVKSKPRKGTVFTIKMPRGKREVAS